MKASDFKGRTVGEMARRLATALDQLATDLHAHDRGATFRLAARRIRGAAKIPYVEEGQNLIRDAANAIHAVDDDGAYSNLELYLIRLSEYLELENDGIAKVYIEKARLETVRLGRS